MAILDKVPAGSEEHTTALALFDAWQSFFPQGKEKKAAEIAAEEAAKEQQEADEAVLRDATASQGLLQKRDALKWGRAQASAEERDDGAAGSGAAAGAAAGHLLDDGEDVEEVIAERVQSGQSSTKLTRKAPRVEDDDLAELEAEAMAEEDESTFTSPRPSQRLSSGSANSKRGGLGKQKQSGSARSDSLSDKLASSLSRYHTQKLEQLREELELRRDIHALGERVPSLSAGTYTSSVASLAPRLDAAAPPLHLTQPPAISQPEVPPLSVAVAFAQRLDELGRRDMISTQEKARVKFDASSSEKEMIAEVGYLSEEEVLLLIRRILDRNPP